MKDYMLEACVDSVESAKAAERGGAKRLELCASLIVGGTTPTASLYRAVRHAAGIGIHILIRPRFGDFCYTDSEFGIIKEEVEQFRDMGADGVVIGILKEDGCLNLEQMGVLVRTAGAMHITLHRAFDVCRDPYQTMEEAIALGIDTILTSGQEAECLKGVALLKKLHEKSAGRMHILAGAGVSSENIGEIYKKTGIRSYHLSGKTLQDSRMAFRKAGVPMGLPGISEFAIWQTEENKIRRAAEVLERS